LEEFRSQDTISAEACFYAEDGVEKERVQAARRNYPNRKKVRPAQINGIGVDENTVQRRMSGFGLGFEKVFATTSIKLPISAYTVYSELHLTHQDVVFNRSFSGVSTIFDLKKWVFEKLQIPLEAYELSYADPGKVRLVDQVPLLTTQNSLEARSLDIYRGEPCPSKEIPGVHSMNSIGITQLYVRLKCRVHGNLLVSGTSCGGFGPRDPEPDQDIFGCLKDKLPQGTGDLCKPCESRGVPGRDPLLEDCWYRPDAKRHCYFHTRGFELYEASQACAGRSELAQIHLSCGMEPSKVFQRPKSALKTRRFAW
jgi:hypothetical protein